MGGLEGWASSERHHAKSHPKVLPPNSSELLGAMDHAAVAVFFCLSPAASSCLVTWLPGCRLGLSAQELHIDVLCGTRCNYIFFPILTNLCGLEQNLTLNLSVSSTHSAIFWSVSISDTTESSLACMQKDCKQSSGYAGRHIYTYLHRNHFFTCFHHLLKKCIAQQQCRRTKTFVRWLLLEWLRWS